MIFAPFFFGLISGIYIIVLFNSNRYNHFMKKIILSLMVIFVFASNARAGDYYAVGVDCFKKGLYDKATTSFEQAVKISPKNVNARYYLAQSYLMQKRISEATDQYDRIIILAPTSDAARLSQKGLSLINQAYKNPTTATTAAVASSGDIQQFGDNYLNYVFASDGSLMKWASFPIKVYIQPKKQKQAAKNAFTQWQEKTKGLVSFEYTNSLSSAQISVDFKDKLETSSTKESYIAGYSKPYYSKKNIIRSEIHILAVDPDTKKDIEDEYIYFSTLHEIGHSLGFKGHSPNENDVMAAQAKSAKTELTQRDVNTMVALYKANNFMVASYAKKSTDVQLQQALDYVKKTPDKAVGWANLGDLYRGKKMYSDAVKNYKKAISIEPDKAELYNLLGTTYSAMGDKQNAFENLKKSCDLDGSNDFFLYQFGQICVSTGKKQIGKQYLNAFLKSKPDAASDEKIKNLMEQL